MMDTVLGILAGSWAVLMAISPLLQIRRIVRLRSSEEVSIPYFGILVLGSCCGSRMGSGSRTWRSSSRTPSPP
jgi:uncharacterized protein with PQ loop repeat